MRKPAPIRPAKKAQQKDNSRPAPRRATPPLVVGVGASAGGIEAFLELISHLPPQPGFSLVLVQHLAPDRESTLPEIFSRGCKMPVSAIREHTRVELNHIYVLPPNRGVRLQDGVLELERRQRGPVTPIDAFLSSLAEAYGSRAIGVLLSGGGHDGTAGLAKIKSAGGITFAQDGKSANVAAMPGAAVAAGVVDLTLPPAQIAQELLRIAQNPYLRAARRREHKEPPQDLDQNLVRVFGLLRALHGVDFSFYKLSTLKRRLMRRMVLRKFTSLPEYVAHLQQNPAELDSLFQDLLINVTAFFRDSTVHAALKNKVFPRLMKQTPTESAIRIWVPGCSSGEEVYSLAISLFEFLGPEAHRRSVQIFGTDISEHALAHARAGIYTESVTSELSPEQLRRFFRETDAGYQIVKSIRDCCVFARQNLVEDPPFSKIDLISCRNVLIYLGPALQKKVIPIFHYALKKGGFLLLGGSETIGGFGNLFTLSDKRNKIYSKRVGELHSELTLSPRPGWAGNDQESTPPKRIIPEPTPLEFDRQVDLLLLSHYSPNGVVINSRMEVVQFRGRTGEFLEHPPGDANLNLMKLVRQELVVDLRTTISRAIKVEGPVRRNGLSWRQGGKTLELSVEVIPFRSSGSRERLFLILFEAGSTAATPTKAAASGKKAALRGRQSERELLHLREELTSTRESLQAIIEEQEATNEELKSANEEIQSSNEELQSTNEELETAKEELQSTNEELTTLNEELQNRNAELSRLNNDLTNLLDSVSMPILMLGNDLTIRRFTPMAERFFNLIPADIGRRITDINPNIVIKNLEGLVTEVIDTLRIQESEVQDREGRWYSLRVRPYRTAENKIDGAVLMLVDIDEIKRGLEELASLVQQPVLTLGGDFTVNRANDAFYAMFQTSREQTEGRSFYDVCEGAWNVPALRTLLEGLLPEKGRADSFPVEYKPPGGLARVFSLSARRIAHQTKGSRIILLSIAEPKVSPADARR